MKIYVDELPKSCAECPMCKYSLMSKIEECCLPLNPFFTLDENEIRVKFCPLQSLAEHDAALLENAIVPPKGFDIGQIVYMIPTETNCLKRCCAYRIISFDKSDIGYRAHLRLITKESGVEQFYCASFDMFGESIFCNPGLAAQKLEELEKEKDDETGN